MQELAVIKSKNLILNSLNDSEFSDISNKLEEIDMPLGKVLYYPNEKLEYVYFPLTSVISIVTLLENGSGIESGIIGREGVSGASVVLTEDSSSFSEATVQLSGSGLRLKVDDFRMFFEENKNFRKIVLNYIHSFITQISQNAACLSYHNIEKRLARWLLMFNDRSEGGVMDMTQEFIAQMLGVHRPSVSKNANKLQKMELITYNRGAIKIVDRNALEVYSCECYETINNAMSKYLNIRKT